MSYFFPKNDIVHLNSKNLTFAARELNRLYYGVWLTRGREEDEREYCSYKIDFAANNYLQKVIFPHFELPFDTNFRIETAYNGMKDCINYKIFSKWLNA